MREYRTIKALRRGEVVELGGIMLKMDVDENDKERQIQVGDLYVAERNTGPKLLTAAEIYVPEGSSIYAGWIRPTSLDYGFDVHECVKVVEA